MASNCNITRFSNMFLTYVLECLVHASQCWCKHCEYSKCHKIKSLLQHGSLCKTRAHGGCRFCMIMWYLLQSHARACKESICPVPRCRDLKEHLRKLASQRREEVDVLCSQLKGLQVLEPNVEQVDELCSQLKAYMDLEEHGQSSSSGPSS